MIDESTDHVLFPKEWVGWLLDELHFIIENAQEGMVDIDRKYVVGFGLVSQIPDEYETLINDSIALSEFIKAQLP